MATIWDLICSLMRGQSTILSSANTVSLFGDSRSVTDTPFYAANWGENFDGTGFNPDEWLDGNGAISLAAFGGPIDIAHITAGWVGGGFLHTANLLPQVNAVPVPPALPLFATGLGVMAWLARRRKRIQTASLP